MDRAALLDEARAWLAADPDPETRSELEALIDAQGFDELEARFHEPLTFGTAGLRAVVGAGPARMNRLVVERTTRAVADYLLESNSGAAAPHVVIGHDARPTSRVFAAAARDVFTAAGVRVSYFEAASATPLVAFAARELSAAAAVVVTASHNPSEYNGYKLYGSNAAQIVAPVDEEIERRSRTVSRSAARRAETATPIDDPMSERYLARLDADRPRGAVDRSLSIVYTPLHGVGGKLTGAALARAGFANVAVVPEQAEPDGTFPTARSPNPEDPKTLALALALAKANGAELVLANDPDADRLAVCVPAPGGGFRTLTGNQIGALLGDFALSRASKAPRPLAVSTIVSSPMLADIARAHGARYEVALTGFKWIWNAALELERRESVRFAFGYEEAIGFSVSGAVRDKDGISAAVWFAELAAECRGSNLTVLERLAELYLRHGLWVSAQHGVLRMGPEGARELARALDAAVRAPPNTLAGRAVTAVRDFRGGREKRPPWLTETPLVLVELGDRGRVLLRPSGTEPKLKVYADLRREAPAGDSIWAAETELEADARRAALELARHVGLG